MFLVSLLLSDFNPVKGFQVGYQIPEQIITGIKSFTHTATGALYLYLRYPIKLEEFGFSKKFFKKTFLFGCIGGAIISLINFPYKTIIGEMKISDKIFIYQNSKLYYILTFLFIVCIFIPIIEEIYFRGFVFKLILLRYDAFLGYVISTGLFIFFHGFSSGGSTVLLIIISLILASLYEKTNAIGACIIAHGLLNLTWYLAVYASMLK